MIKTISKLLLVPVFAILVTSCADHKDDPLYYQSKRPAGEAEAPIKDIPADILAAQRAFSQVSKKAMPFVVNISTVSRKKVVHPFPELPPFFEEFFGGNPQTRRDRSLGSGFIISRDGYIVTNDHVVRNAESIRVKLSNDRVYDALVVGGDQKTDIAVIKIDAEELPTAVLGDSDQIEIGQWAIAIGNPFGLERSMTVGVISATGRSNMGIEVIENFIQTDASINPGNSGGPLLNIHGEVVGINTAIVASGQGIGFAIPTNMARPIISQLVDHGKVTRAWLGVNIRGLAEEELHKLGLKQTSGAMVVGLYERGPAAQGGLQPGDIIVSLGGIEVKDPAQLQQLVAEARIGEPLKITVLRNQQRLILSVKPGNADSLPAGRWMNQETE